MHLVVDPVLLLPPADGGERAWIYRTRELTHLVDESAIEASSPKHARECVWAIWFGSDSSVFRGPVTRNDLVRVLEELDGRLSGAVIPPHGEVVVEDTTVQPRYQPDELDADCHSDFSVHLGMAACAKQEGVVLVDVVSPTTSWEEDASDLLVEGRIELRDSPAHGAHVPEDDESGIRSYLRRVETPREALARLYDHPCVLIQHPELGIRATWVAHFDGSTDELEFEFGPEFVASVAALNYQHEERYAKACLRTMALLAAGKFEDVPGHIERTGSGGNDPHLKNDRGQLVHRSYLAQNSPNAHRLFWAKGDAPCFLNVDGHEGTPRL